METTIARLLATLPSVAQFHALRRLPALVPALSPDVEACLRCGSLEPSTALSCGFCGSDPCTTLEPVEVVTGDSWLPLLQGAAAIGRRQQTAHLRNNPAVAAERDRRAIQDAFLRATRADAQTADLLARRWLFMLDSEVAGGGQ